MAAVIYCIECKMFDDRMSGTIILSKEIKRMMYTIDGLADRRAGGRQEDLNSKEKTLLYKCIW